MRISPPLAPSVTSVRTPSPVGSIREDLTIRPHLGLIRISWPPTNSCRVERPLVVRLLAGLPRVQLPIPMASRACRPRNFSCRPLQRVSTKMSTSICSDARNQSSSVSFAVLRPFVLREATVRSAFDPRSIPWKAREKGPCSRCKMSDGRVDHHASGHQPVPSGSPV